MLVKLRPGTQLTALPDGSARVRSDEGLCFLEGRNAWQLMSRILPILVNGYDIEELLAKVPRQQQDKIVEILGLLTQKGILFDVAKTPNPLVISVSASDNVQTILVENLKRAGYEVDLHQDPRRAQLRIACLSSMDHASMQAFDEIRALGPGRFIGCLTLGSTWLGPIPGQSCAFTSNGARCWQQNFESENAEPITAQQQQLLAQWLSCTIVRSLKVRQSWPSCNGNPIAMLAFDVGKLQTFNTEIASWAHLQADWQVKQAVEGILALSNVPRNHALTEDKESSWLRESVRLAGLLSSPVVKMGEGDDVQLPLCSSVAQLKTPDGATLAAIKRRGLSFSESRQRALDEALINWSQKVEEDEYARVQKISGQLISLPKLELCQTSDRLQMLGEVLSENWSGVFVKAAYLWQAKENLNLASTTLNYPYNLGKDTDRLHCVARRLYGETITAEAHHSSSDVVTVSLKQQGVLYLGAGYETRSALRQALYNLIEKTPNNLLHTPINASPVQALSLLQNANVELCLEPLPRFTHLVNPPVVCRVYLRTNREKS